MPAINKELSDIKTDVALLKKDISGIDQYAKNINVAVEKMSDLTSSLHRMITLHEERISQQTDDEISLRSRFEQHLTEDKVSFEKIENKISDSERNLLSKLDSLHIKISKNDLSKSALSGGLMLLAFIIGPILSGYCEAYFQKLIHP